MGVPVALTERDLELLESLLTYRYLSTSQVQRLHFPSAQTALRRLRRLTDAGYVTAFKSVACADRIATLSRLGAETVAGRLSMPVKDLGWEGRRQEPKDYLFLKHFLAASEFRITLTQACAKHPGMQLLGFIAEHEATPSGSGSLRKRVQDSVHGSRGEEISHSPDGVFALSYQGKPALFFLEIDRGTETLSNPERGFLKMIWFYLAYLRDGGYRRYGADFGVEEPFKGFRALVVTTTEARLQSMREAAGRLPFDPPHAKRFIWLATAAVLHDCALGWSPAEPADNTSYHILPRSDPRPASRIHQTMT